MLADPAQKGVGFRTVEQTGRLRDGGCLPARLAIGRVERVEEVASGVNMPTASLSQSGSRFIRSATRLTEGASAASS